MWRKIKNNSYMNKIIYEDMQFLYKRGVVDWKRFSNKTVLITGAYGVIASYIVFMLIFLNELQNYNIKIITLCRDENKLRKQFGQYVDKEYFTIYKGDLTNTIKIIDEKVNYIIHGASPAGTQHFIENPVGVIVPNTIGLYNLLEYSRINGLEGFLFMSSNSIYGINAGKNVTEHNYGIVDPLNIRACYIESKRLGEQMCNAYFRQYGIKTKIVRISHTYGPTLDIVNDKRAIARFCSNILHGEDIVLFKDENAKVQYGYTADIINGCIKVLIDGEAGEAYNVCGDEFLPMHEIAEILVSLFPGSNSKVSYKELTKDYLFGQNQGINSSKCCNKKLKELGWNIEYPLVKGFKRTIKSLEGDID